MNKLPHNVYFHTLLWLGISFVFNVLPACALPSEITMKNTRYGALHANIKIVGRHAISKQNTVLFGYPGASINFKIRAKDAFIYLKSSQGNSFVDIVVDGTKIGTYQVPTSINAFSLFVGDSIEEHNISIFNRTETWQGTLEFDHVVAYGGKLVAPTTTFASKLLFIGDSVTCGEAIDRPEIAKAEDKNAAWWNGPASYGMLIGKELNAETHLVCYGGRGLIRSWNGVTSELKAADFFELAIPWENKQSPWDHSQFAPDLIFIAIGTNDFSNNAGPLPDKLLFEEKYVEFIQRLQKVHPRAKIVVTEGAILSVNDRNAKGILASYLQAIVNRFNNNHIVFIPSTHYPGDSIDGHPTKAQHVKMAQDFAPKIKALLSSH